MFVVSPSSVLPFLFKLNTAGGPVGIVLVMCHGSEHKGPIIGPTHLNEPSSSRDRVFGVFSKRAK